MIKIFKNRVIILYILLTLAFCLFSVIFISKYFEKKNLDFYVKNLKTEIKTVYSINLFKKNDDDFLYQLSKKVFEENGIRLTFIKEDGRVIADSEVLKEDLLRIENHKERPEVKDAIKYGEGFSIRFSTTAKKEMLYLSIAKDIDGEKLIIRASVPFKEFRKDIKDIRNNVLLFFVFAYFVIFASGFFIIRKLFKPMDKIIFASKQYASGNFDYKINIDFTGEMKKLAETLNSMSQNIEKNIQELEYKNKMLSIIIEGMDEAIVIVSEDRRILSYNNNFKKFFGITGTEIAMRNINHTIREPAFVDLISDFSKISFKKTDIKLLSGKHVSVFSFPLDYGSRQNHAFVIYDIDKQKKLEIMRREFIANFSHEIKTPLAVVKANIETIVSLRLSGEEMLIFLKAAEKNILRMENIIRDIIKLSYLEGYAKPEFLEVDLGETILEVLRYFEAQIYQKKIEVKKEISDIKIKADKNLVEDALFNLIDNAVKYNKGNGFIKVVSEKNSQGYVVCIENSGPEIGKDYLDRVFERFFTVDKSRSKDLGGTGLGLSIVKHIMEIHNGYVKAESDKGVNKFYLIFPF